MCEKLCKEVEILTVRVGAYEDAHRDNMQAMHERFDELRIKLEGIDALIRNGLSHNVLTLKSQVKTLWWLLSTATASIVGLLTAIVLKLGGLL